MPGFPAGGGPEGDGALIPGPGPAHPIGKPSPERPWGGMGPLIIVSLEQKEYDSSDSDAALPMVHRIISNFKAYVEGAFHGLSKARMQSYADSFSWRYSHRDSGDAFGDLLHGMCLMHIPLSRIAVTATIQPKLPKQLTVHGA